MKRAPTGVVELERLVAGVDGDRHGADGGHGLHQGALAAGGDVDEAGVIGRVELGVIAAVSLVLEAGKTPQVNNQSLVIKQ